MIVILAIRTIIKSSSSQEGHKFQKQTARRMLQSTVVVAFIVGSGIDSTTSCVTVSGRSDGQGLAATAALVPLPAIPRLTRKPRQRSVPHGHTIGSGHARAFLKYASKGI